MSGTAYGLSLAALAFATWAVYLGGLASLQAECDTDRPVTIAVSNGLPCSKTYRMYWFYMSWEFVVIFILAAVAIAGKVASMRTSLVGLFAIGTLLFIDASNVFLTAESRSYFESGQPEHRIRTITAGAIMTAVVNALSVLILGMDLDISLPGTKQVESTNGANGV